MSSRKRSHDSSDGDSDGDESDTSMDYGNSPSDDEETERKQPPPPPKQKPPPPKQVSQMALKPRLLSSVTYHGHTLQECLTGIQAGIMRRKETEALYHLMEVLLFSKCNAPDWEAVFVKLADHLLVVLVTELGASMEYLASYAVFRRIELLAKLATTKPIRIDSDEPLPGWKRATECIRLMCTEFRPVRVAAAARAYFHDLPAIRPNPKFQAEVVIPPGRQQLLLSHLHEKDNSQVVDAIAKFMVLLKDHDLKCLFHGLHVILDGLPAGARHGFGTGETYGRADVFIWRVLETYAEQQGPTSACDGRGLPIKCTEAKARFVRVMRMAYLRLSLVAKEQAYACFVQAILCLLPPCPQNTLTEEQEAGTATDLASANTPWGGGEARVLLAEHRERAPIDIGEDQPFLHPDFFAENPPTSRDYLNRFPHEWTLALAECKVQTNNKKSAKKGRSVKIVGADPELDEMAANPKKRSKKDSAFAALRASTHSSSTSQYRRGVGIPRAPQTAEEKHKARVQAAQIRIVEGQQKQRDACAFAAASSPSILWDRALQDVQILSIDMEQPMYLARLPSKKNPSVSTRIVVRMWNHHRTATVDPVELCKVKAVLGLPHQKFQLCYIMQSGITWLVGLDFVNSHSYVSTPVHQTPSDVLAKVPVYHTVTKPLQEWTPCTQDTKFTDWFVLWTFLALRYVMNCGKTTLSHLVMFNGHWLSIGETEGIGEAQRKRSGMEALFSDPIPHPAFFEKLRASFQRDKFGSLLQKWRKRLEGEKMDFFASRADDLRRFASDPQWIKQ